MEVFVQKNDYEVGDFVRFMCANLTYNGTIVAINDGIIWGERFAGVKFYSIEVLFVDFGKHFTDGYKKTTVTYAISKDSILGMDARHFHHV